MIILNILIEEVRCNAAVSSIVLCTLCICKVQHFLPFEQYRAGHCLSLWIGFVRKERIKNGMETFCKGSKVEDWRLSIDCLLNTVYDAENM